MYARAGRIKHMRFRPSVSLDAWSTYRSSKSQLPGSTHFLNSRAWRAQICLVRRGPGSLPSNRDVLSAGCQRTPAPGCNRGDRAPEPDREIPRETLPRIPGHCRQRQSVSDSARLKVACWPRSKNLLDLHHGEFELLVSRIHNLVFGSSLNFNWQPGNDLCVSLLTLALESKLSRRMW
jgi:hypothetical protein